MKEMPVLLIDNTSPLSCSFMQFIYNSGGFDKFKFLSIYSDESKRLLSSYDMPDRSNCVMVLLDNGKVFTDSMAFFQSARKLAGAIPIFLVFIVTRK